MTKARNLCFTLNNWTEDELTEIKNIKSVRYLIIGKEVGDSGTSHLQGYIEFENPRTLNAIYKINPRIHWEKRRGTAKQASDYCKKENNFEEIGELTRQGERTDLTELKEQIMAGEKKVDDVILENPETYHQYGRTLEKIEDLKMAKVFRTEMTECVWIVGKTGVGKSHAAFENYSPETHYVKPHDGSWWDGYKQQDTVIFNDFRGDIQYGFLLELIDKWPVSVNRRNRMPIPFISKKIIITSVLEPQDVYPNVNTKDGIDQLLRRITLVRRESSGHGTEQ